MKIWPDLPFYAKRIRVCHFRKQPIQHVKFRYAWRMNRRFSVKRHNGPHKLNTFCYVQMNLEYKETLWVQRYISAPFVSLFKIYNFHIITISGIKLNFITRVKSLLELTVAVISSGSRFACHQFLQISTNFISYEILNISVILNF